MTGAAKRGWVPKLRFPAFREAGEWEPNAIGDEVDLLSGYPFDGIDISENPKGTILLRGINITEGVIRHSKEIDRYYLGDISKIEKYKTEIDDLVIAMDGSKVGKNVALITPRDKGALLVQRVARLRAKRSIPIQFIFQQINSTSFQNYVDRINTSSGIPHISASQINEFEIHFPQIPEQQKIADCLASLDERITLEAQKLDTLKTHKKGLMQQLFPAEGETLPKLRFPVFRDAGEWETRSVSQFAKVTTGAKDTQNKVDGGHYPFFVRSQTVERIDSYSYDGEAILTSGDGVGVGKNFHYIKGKFDFHQRVYCIYDFDEGVSGLFFHLYFSEHFGERVMRMSAKNSVDSVRMAMITEMPVMLPSILEQQKIADCLTSLDDLITAQTQKLTALKTHKKGLMQQLFPSVGGVPEGQGGSPSVGGVAGEA